jgi:hypothetical protein
MSAAADDNETRVPVKNLDYPDLIRPVGEF